MQRKLFAVLTLASLIAIAAPSLARNHRKDNDTRFTVRVENISSKDGQTASTGVKWPFALSPGMWVTHEREVRLYKEGVAAGSAMEAQAEDGSPAELVKTLVSREHSGMQHGVFNTPVGASAPGPIRPGDSYEFTITGKLGMKLSMTMMFGQSNDWFYATPAQGISLFDNGKPIGGDITSRFILFDAGTEKDEELGIGPNQGPRQKAPNTGEAENGVVHKAKGSPFFTRNSDLFRITIMPEEKM